ncbi:ParB/RepB/Spo0J family partition protein [Pseudonocardia parietis]|uniref:ParB-like chromosome segregation protein Spo0J n=1 Tax=Pseudonocardia parietis TaxID=570936 RepID=A0ABS4W5R5_9PSEU|nr:ParB N-terminal domain-containing protein [Pseudonocardia parietis]MBP2371549.1 ParB-like chromosome segregation protein Spo0J [Pseudonocardia parietis]
MDLIRVSVEALDDLDPDRDVRTERGSLDELACSLITHGLLNPLTVIPGENGRYVIHAGGRRRAALRRAAELLAESPEEFGFDDDQAAERTAELTGQVPCWVRADLAGREALTQLAENGERRELSASERYRGLQLAFADGLDDREIAHAAGVKLAHVRTARQTSQFPDAAQEAIAAGQLDLDTATELYAFRDDGKATARLLRRIEQSPQQAPYAIAEEQQKRQRAAAAEQIKAEAREAGYTVRGQPGCLHWGYDGPDELFEFLTHSDGAPLTGEIDGAGDGHCAFVEQAYDGPRLRHFCTNPEAHGHTRARHTSYRTPDEVARLEAERTAADEHRLALDAARTVRGKFLRSLIGSQKVAARHTDLLATVAARFPALLGQAERHHLADELMPVVPEQWNPPRATQHAVARAVLAADAAAEGIIGWRRDREAALWWWNTLAALGYERGDAETAHVGALEAEAERRTAEIAAAAEQGQAAADAAEQALAEHGLLGPETDDDIA